MRLVDSRRLTGPNRHMRGPAAIAEVAFDPGDDVTACVDAWREAVAGAHAALGWPTPHSEARVFSDRSGAALVFATGVDTLYAATEINEWALGPRSPMPLDDWRAALAEERNPALLALLHEARAHGVPLLWDDEVVSIGLGRRGRSWPARALPEANDVPWRELGSIPVVAITGTNGKTTSARLLARIAQQAGRSVGYTTTDGVVVGETCVEEGDCTGPMGARTVLRHPEVDFAVLETARGGLLRRGFALEGIDAALMTNVDAEHLGEYGIQTVDELAQAKAVVAEAVRPAGHVVLAADSEAVARLSGRFVAPEIWFSLHAESPRLVQAHVAGRETWTVSADGHIERRHAGRVMPLMPVAEIPLAMGGLARHNVANVLGVVALATALELSPTAIVEALHTFGTRPQDNPGRNERYEIDGVTVLLDFAHNVEGIRAQRPVIEALRRGGSSERRRLLVSIGMAGDRDDDTLSAVAREVAALAPDRVIVREQPEYLRGRAPGEVPAVLQRAFVAAGIAEEAIERAENGPDAMARAHAWARPGDVVTVFVHTDRDAGPPTRWWPAQ